MAPSTTSDSRLRLATRASTQARTQSQAVADALCAAHDGLTVELVLVDTTGDQRGDVPLHTIGGQGVFVKEVQQAVLRGDADIAVHSAKDLPSATSPGLVLAAFTARRDPADALVGATLNQLVHGATVATGSVRRRSELAAVRPDLEFVELRGLIHTRLSKVPEGGAIVMAVAALQVLELTERISERLDPEVFVPSPGQGCVAVECRHDDGRTRQLLASIDHGATRSNVSCERALLAELGSGCSLPVGAYAVDGRLIAFLADPASGRHVRSTAPLVGPDHARTRAAAELARSLVAQLAAEVAAS